VETSTNSFVLYMYLVAIGGAFLGLMYPKIIASFKGGPGPTYHTFGASSSIGGWVRYLAAGLLISAIVVTLGFGGFLSDADNKKALDAMGLVAYTLAFGFGFGAGQLAEEPLKKTS
jgi:hypothetical protein